MTAKTLKQLIEIEYDRCETISQFKAEVFRLIDLYESESTLPFFVPNQLINNPVDDKVPYHEICGCNPKNGGSGICGCVIGNQLVPVRKGSTNYTWTSTSSNTNIV